MLRYLRKLQLKDLALDRSMIPLGSCTMKLNAATEMMPVSMAGFAHIHPFAPKGQTSGLPAAVRRPRGLALPHHRLRRRLAAAQCRQPGRVCRSPEHPRLSPLARRCRARCLPHSLIRARHQPGQRRHGRHAGRGGRLRRAGQCRHRRSDREGGGARGPTRGPDDHLPLDPRRVRGERQGGLRRHPRAMAGRSTWTAPI